MQYSEVKNPTGPVPARLKSLDVLKGVGIFVFIFVHFGMFFNDDSWLSLRELLFILLRPAGPANYIICSLIGVLLSIRTVKNADKQEKNLLKIAKRFLFFLILGSMINMVNFRNVLLNPDIWILYKIFQILFTWNMLTFIGFAQVIIYIIRDLSFISNIILLIAAIGVYHVLIPVFINSFNLHDFNYKVDELTMIKGVDLPVFMYFVFFFQNSHAPFFPWVEIIFLVNMTYKRFSRILKSPGASIENILREIQRIQVLSLVFLFSGMLFGLEINEGILNINEYLVLTRKDSWHAWNEDWNGYPVFLQFNSPMNVLYSFGLLSFFTITVMKYIDFKKRKIPGVDTLSSLGKYSLTIFISHAAIALLPIKLEFFSFLFFYAGFMVVLSMAIRVWDEDHHGIGGLEWIASKFIKSPWIQEHHVSATREKINNIISFLKNPGLDLAKVYKKNKKS
ncbi:MAG: hypothetical protein ACTSXU_07325 [Promethearchaeota archaeon]